MNFIKLFCAISCALCMTAHTAPVIINDTGDWNGEIQAIEEGFFVYNVGMWTQYGANFHSGKLISSFIDDFSPIITNEGTNYVTCTYDQVGWIWPYGGPTLEETISFETKNLIIEPPVYYLNAPDTNVGVSITPYPLATYSEFPANGIIVTNMTIGLQDSFWADVSGAPIVNWVSYGGGIMSLMTFLGPKFNIVTGAISLLTAAISQTIDAKTIESITFDEPFSPPETEYPDPSDTRSYTIKTKADGWVMNIKIYDGGEKGFAPNGETTYLQQVFFKNLRRVHVYDLYKNPDS